MLAADGQPAIIFGKLEIIVIAGVLHPRRCIFPDTSTILGFDPASCFPPMRGLLTGLRECHIKRFRLIGGSLVAYSLVTWMRDETRGEIALCVIYWSMRRRWKVLERQTISNFLLDIFIMTKFTQESEIRIIYLFNYFIIYIAYLFFGIGCMNYFPFC